jgi:hypothetical protein
MRRTNLSQLTASTAVNKPQEACLSSFHAATILVLVAFDGFTLSRIDAVDFVGLKVAQGGARERRTNK